VSDYYLQYLEEIDELGVEVSRWEADFLESMLKQRPQRLSQKQQEIVRCMAKRYLHEDIN
jgi:hypothetical protein